MFILRRVDLADWHMWWKQKGATGVRRILMETWDPIGVADAPEAADEYDSYLGPLGAQLREGATATAIENYLRHVRKTLMGLDSPSWRPRDQATAQRLFDWYAAEMRPPGA